MSIQQCVLIGYANGDVHLMQVMKGQQASQIAVEESKQIGHLSNAGFRTVVASAWSRADTKTAGMLYAAAWNQNDVEVVLHFGDRIASSHELYRAIVASHDGSMTAMDLIRLCRQSKIE